MLELTADPGVTAMQPSPLADLDDAALVGRMREGDLRARAALIRRYVPLAKLLAFRASRKIYTIEAEELVSLAFMALVESVDMLDPSKGKLGTVLHWRFRAQLSAARERHRLPVCQVDPDEVTSGDDDARAVLERRDLAQALTRCLNPQERAMTNLLFGLDGQDEHTGTGIARIAGISPQRVSVVLANALGKMRARAAAMGVLPARN